MDAKLAEDWRILLNLRDSIFGKIEKAREDGIVKAPREVVAKIRVQQMILRA